MKKMSNDKYKIISQFVKDLSSETENVETFIHVSDHISNYHLNIEINSKPLKNLIVEVNTTLKFQDPNDTLLKSIFEINYATIVKIEKNNISKEEMQKMLLVELQEEIYPELKRIFLNTIHDAGYKSFTMDKDIDFKKLYETQSN
tara:strand:- start:325 stop:759 length:435 start_codon:yes stop_codon:yes gene_type:complete